MTALSVLTNGCVARSAARLRGRCLAEEILLLDRGEAGMRIGASDQAELVRVHPELGFHLEAVAQRRTPVLEFQHLGLLGDSEIEVALVPYLEVRKLIVRRQERMRFAVALDLRHLVERLPAHPVLGIFAVDTLAGERLDDREHDARCSDCRCARAREFRRRSFPRSSPSTSKGRADSGCRAAAASCTARPARPWRRRRAR